MAWWCNGYGVGLAGLTAGRCISHVSYDSEPVVHTCASVTKQHNLILAKGR